MSEIKYVTPSGLAHYDEKIKEVIDKVDTSTNTKVTQTPTSSNETYPLLLSPTGQTSEVNTTSYFNSDVVLNPSTKTISANIDGNAETATKAVQDGDGNTITTTYVKETPEFTESTERNNIESKESMSTILGKVKKYFTDLKSHAFNALANNLTTTTEGYALDATQGKALQDKIGSTDISAIGGGTLTGAVSSLNTDLSIELYSILYNENLVDTNLFSDLSTVYITTYGKVAIVYGTLFAKAEINGAYPAFNTVAKGLTPNSQSFALSAIVENTDVDVYFAVDENLFFDIVASRGSIPAGSVIRVFGSFILK